MAMVLLACSGSGSEPTLPPRSGPLIDARGYRLPPAPEVPSGPLEPALVDRINLTLDLIEVQFDPVGVGAIAESGDARLAWLLSDLLRFIQIGSPVEQLRQAFEQVTGVDLDADPSSAESVWRSVTNHLIAWDLPAPPGYREMKAKLFLLVDPRWEPFFADEDADIDWRLLSWGGVLIDDRPLGDPNPCRLGCIPALDDPALTDAAGGDWYSDGLIIFGVVVNDEAVALPKHIMEVHEMVNLTIGGRRLGIPYCTLCGSAQAYLTDIADPALVLRTSGLLSRSNKVMYDLDSRSVFDTFTGAALSGRLQDEGVALEQVSVVSSKWGEWKQAHPDTRIVAQDGGIGRIYPEDPLQGRDAAGPIFPVGDVDPRLPVQAQVVGVISPSGLAVAFPVEQAGMTIDAGGRVEVGGVTLRRDGGGFVAISADGTRVVAHQAFWFAWSQFHPDTVVWTPIGPG